MGRSWYPPRVRRQLALHSPVERPQVDLGLVLAGEGHHAGAPAALGNLFLKKNIKPSLSLLYELTRERMFVKAQMNICTSFNIHDSSHDLKKDILATSVPVVARWRGPNGLDTFPGTLAHPWATDCRKDPASYSANF